MQTVFETHSVRGSLRPADTQGFWGSPETISFCQPTIVDRASTRPLNGTAVRKTAVTSDETGSPGRRHKTSDPLTAGCPLSGVVQPDNGPPKRHNATQQRDNVKTPERGTENPQFRPNFDLAIFKLNVELTIVNKGSSKTPKRLKTPKYTKDFWLTCQPVDGRVRVSVDWFDPSRTRPSRSGDFLLNGLVPSRRDGPSTRHKAGWDEALIVDFGDLRWPETYCLTQHQQIDRSSFWRFCHFFKTKKWKRGLSACHFFTPGPV
ncbi:hypothetical protein C8R43DRAFT_1152021 [Mycena crocata]|nr:hypothetical protein C8R43DRAFT_1152021 [Mycena crocata]